MTHDVLSIGHSTLAYERFVSLLNSASVNAIADVRSSPYSRHFPHFNREALRKSLRQNGIAYVFLGDALGGRPKDGRLFSGSVADYEKMAGTALFKEGLERVVEGARTYRIAMMCSEHDPLDCHRCLLVGRALRSRVSVGHILGTGAITSQEEIEDKLMRMSGNANADLFEPHEIRLAKAYRERSMKIAYTEAPGP